MTTAGGKEGKEAFSADPTRFSRLVAASDQLARLLPCPSRAPRDSRFPPVLLCFLPRRRHGHPFCPPEPALRSGDGPGRTRRRRLITYAQRQRRRSNRAAVCKRARGRLNMTAFSALAESEIQAEGTHSGEAGAGEVRQNDLW
ncbi:MAG: hypothetical protein BJ554DRAFT_8449 [Olpidium bornovanus]|uniref:Uncharacterized protein n=1 Tax=Olpidium bornovanus TaxID=278681 RepID=A0A8H8DI90_9FUNG|nr:MAG: hypothetical protein BJ554DRAFT_8449 [Olpidium bornovanus]